MQFTKNMSDSQLERVNRNLRTGAHRFSVLFLQAAHCVRGNTEIYVGVDVKYTYSKIDRAQRVTAVSNKNKVMFG